MSLVRRHPALFLLLLAPLVSEFLLGNIPLSRPSSAALYPVLVMLYGGGALLIREVTVRRGRGWPSVFLLALAYGVIEGGLITQSLFSLRSAGLELNSYGQLPGLSTGASWAIFVLTIVENSLPAAVVAQAVLIAAAISLLFAIHARGGTARNGLTQ